QPTGNRLQAGEMFRTAGQIQQHEPEQLTQVGPGHHLFQALVPAIAAVAVQFLIISSDWQDSGPEIAGFDVYYPAPVVHKAGIMTGAADGADVGALILVGGAQQGGDRVVEQSLGPDALQSSPLQGFVQQSVDILSHYPTGLDLFG